MLMQIATIFTFSILIYLSLAFTYSAVLALLYFIRKKDSDCGEIDPKKIAIIIPAHNEELIIGGLCDNLKEIKYNKENYDIYFVADNCTDQTARICREKGFKVFEREDETKKGKGYAINYGFKNVPLDRYDAFLIIDADTYVDVDILKKLSKYLIRKKTAIQCYIKIPNINESWFTRLLSVARVMNGLFYHYPKSMLGLSSYLMGSGICFSADLIKEKGWTAFSIAEDWEYYAQLILDGYRVIFAKEAIVYQYESRSLGQATSQRLRWSSGRWRVTKTLGVKLMAEGLRKRSLILFDASLPLIFPNYSLQINLALVALVFALALPASAWKVFIVVVLLSILMGQGLLFVAGAFVAGSPRKTFCAVFYIPIFLIWKSVIDILCFTGIYRGKKWVRTRRHQS